MTKRNIERVVLVNNQHLRAYIGEKEAQGAIFQLPKIFGMIREIAPENYRTRLATKCQFKIPYSTDDAGFFDIRVQRNADLMKVEIIAIAPAKQKPISVSSTQWAPSLLPQPRGHKKAVTGVSIAPDGILLASASLDGRGFMEN